MGLNAEACGSAVASQAVRELVCRRVAVGLVAIAAFAASGCTKHGSAPGLCHLDGPTPPTKVNVISYPSQGMPYFGERMTQCSGNGGLQVRHQMLPYEELVNQATIAMSSHTPSNYHIIHVYDGLLVEWAAKGWLAPLDDLVAKYRDRYRLAEIPDSVWDLMKYDGHIYAVPAIQNVQTFFYRKDLFAKYGLEVPKTYDDVRHACQVLHDQGKVQYPLVVMYAKQQHLAYEFHNMVHSLGGRWFSDTGEPEFNGAIGVMALEKIRDLYRSCVHPGVVNFPVEDATIGLQQGQFVMAVMWMNEAPRMDDPALSRFAGRFGFAPAPAACPTCPVAAYWAQDSWVIPANSSVDRDLLFRIAMEGTNTDAQAHASRLALVTRVTVARAAESPYWSPGVETIRRGATAMPRQPYTYLAIAAIEHYGIDALLGKLSSQEALDQAAAEFSKARREEAAAK